MTSRTASTAFPASLLPMLARFATWSTNSDFVTLGLLLDEVRGRTTLSAVPDVASRNPAWERRFPGSVWAKRGRWGFRVHGADGSAVWPSARTGRRQTA